MWDRDLVSRLSPKASQVLLSLLLSRSLEVQYSSAEFATLTGLGQRSIAPALFELRSYGLIDIIPQPGKPPLVRLVHPEEYRYETTVTAVGPTSVEEGTSGILLAAGNGDKGEGRATKDDTPSGTGLATPGERTVLQRSDDDGLAIEQGLLNNCQLADQGQDAGLRIAALQDVWSYAFPVEEYPYQRLSNDAAKRLLVNRTAEWVGGVILDSVKHAHGKIASPRAYIEKALGNEERRKALKETGVGQSGQVIITDELRRLAELGRQQFIEGVGDEKDKNSGGDKR